MFRTSLIATAVFSFSVSAIANAADVAWLKSAGGMSIKVTKLGEGLSHPNGLVFLPDGRTMLLTERAGRLRRVTDEDDAEDPAQVA